METIDTKNIFNIVGFRICNPNTAIPFLPSHNHIGSVLLFQLVNRALEARGLLIDPVAVPSTTSGELNNSNYLFFVNHLGDALKTLDEILTASTLRPLATLVYFDFSEHYFRAHGPNPAGVAPGSPFDMAVMAAQHKDTTAMLEIVRKHYGLNPTPAEPPPTDNP